MYRLKRKLLFILLLAAFFSFIPKQNTFALEKEEIITVKINEAFVKTEVEPYYKYDKMYVPARSVCEALNAEVCWMPEEKSALISYDGKYIQLMPEDTNVIIDGKKHQLEVPVELIESCTMIPVDLLVEAFGATIEWDEYTYSLDIEIEGTEIPDEYIKNYCEEDLIWLARITEVEGRGLSIDGKVAIANVVLNRKKSPKFPGTIYGVIFDNTYSTQFPPAFRNGFRESTPSKDSIIAAKMALEGINNIDNCLYFNNHPFKGKANDLYKIIEGEYFYY